MPMSNESQAAAAGLQRAAPLPGAGAVLDAPEGEAERVFAAAAELFGVLCERRSDSVEIWRREPEQRGHPWA